MAELTGPRRAAASGRAAQLVVACHGVGADGADMAPVCEHLASCLPDAAFAMPDAPEPYDGGPGGRQWFSLRDRRPAVLLAGAATAAAALGSYVATELDRLGLAPDAYALFGFSQGAMLVLHAGLVASPPPRAVLAFSGGLPDAEAAFGASRTPVLLVHGEADEVVPPSRSRATESALRRTGVPVEALYPPGIGHWVEEAGLRAGCAMLRRVFDPVIEA